MTDTEVELVLDEERDVNAGLPVLARRSTVEVIGVPTIATVAENLAKAREFMQTVMVRGIDGDYDTIPGCGKKPVLLQPGAEKLATLFNLSHTTERTIFERGDGEIFVGYRTVVTNIHGATVGDVEAVADSQERSFRRNGDRTVDDNGVMQRASKRSFVAAIRQATAISDLFSSGNMSAPSGLSEDQRAIVVALYAATLPSQAERAMKQAAKVTTDQWSAFLGSAVDAAGDKFEWDSKQRAYVYFQLDSGLITADEVAELVESQVAS